MIRNWYNQIPHLTIFLLSTYAFGVQRYTLKIFYRRMDTILVSNLVILLCLMYYVHVLIIMSRKFSNIWFILPKADSCVWMYRVSWWHWFTLAGRPCMLDAQLMACDTGFLYNNTYYVTHLIVLTVEVFCIGYSFHLFKSFKLDVTELCHVYVFHLYERRRQTRTRHASSWLVNIIFMSTNQFWV